MLEYNTPFAGCGSFPCVGGSANLVFGQSGSFTSNGCDSDKGGDFASAIDLCGPAGVALDASGNLYVADESNSRVLEYNNPMAPGGGTPGTPGSAGDTTADLVFGQGGSFTSFACNFDTGGGNPTANDLCDPAGVALDSIGNLYITDHEQ